MDATDPRDPSKEDLQDWLEDVYFNKDKRVEFSKDEIYQVGKVIGRMLRLEPDARPSAEDILQDSWFDEE